MSTLNIKSNEMFSIDVTVRESDKYTKSVLVKLDRNFKDKYISGCTEMYLTPAELYEFGHFLVSQSAKLGRKIDRD